jgi:hypothetical protein
VRGPRPVQDELAQVKPPLEPQLLPVEAPLPLFELNSEAKDEIFFFVFGLWQAGQAGFWLTAEKLTIFSNSFPQSLQAYSYKGMGILLKR